MLSRCFSTINKDTMYGFLNVFLLFLLLSVFASGAKKENPLDVRYTRIVQSCDRFTDPFVYVKKNDDACAPIENLILDPLQTDCLK